MGLVIFFTRYSLEGPGSGGGRRARQLIEEFDSEDLSVFSAMKEGVNDSLQALLRSCDNYSLSKRFGEKIRLLFHIYALRTDYFRWDKSWRPAVFWMWRMAHTWIGTCRTFKTIDYVLLEDPFFYFPLTSYLLERKIPIVAVIQNLETLFQHYCSEKHRIPLLKKELLWLNKCLITVTNSREEATFLTNVNVKNIFFPYFPDRNAEEHLRKIKEKQNTVKKEYFVLLGTAGNKATSDGMKELIQFWKQDIRNKTLIVIGHNSLELQPFADGERVLYKGPVSEEEFESIISETRAVICYQKRGPGALTRIADMLVAHVPVIANSHALRSYYNLPGITEFRSLIDLQKILRDFGDVPLHVSQNYQKPTGLKEQIREMVLRKNTRQS